MGNLIYILKDDGKLIEMEEKQYDSENLLQKLLAEYPKLLAGDQINSESPRKWLLIAREAGLAVEEEGGARWFVDHLFLDQEGIPTLVEVKQGTNADIRRKVVGQMLDYAANAVVYWPLKEIQSQFDRYHKSRDEIPENILSEEK